MDQSSGFSILKPLGDEIVKEPTVDNILKLKDVIPSISSRTLQELQFIVLFPLEYNLHNTNHKLKVRQSLVDCMKEIVQRTYFNNINKFFQVYSILFFQLFEKNLEPSLPQFPEEFKLSVIECATCLIKQLPTDLLFDLYSKENAPKLAQGLYVCLNVAKNEKYQTLRLAAMECMRAHAYVHNEADKDDIVLRHEVGEVLMFFLPGIVSGLGEIARTDVKQGHQVTLLAVKTWSELITIVMEDSNRPPDAIKDDDMDFTSKPQEMTDDDSDHEVLVAKWEKSAVETMKQGLQKMSRTTRWYQAAAKRLSNSTKIVVLLHQHPHNRVRQELSSACLLLLSRCFRNMEPSITYLVEALIVLSDDEHVEVAATSKQTLQMFSNKYESECHKSVVALLEENFYNWITKLPRYLHETDDNNQRAVLKMLAGYIKLLGVKKLEVLNSVAHLNRLMLTLLQAVEFECNCISLLEEYTLRDIEADHLVGHTANWKVFKHFRDKDLYKMLEQICYLLGQYGDLKLLIYSLLDILQSASYRHKEAVFLLNEILVGGATREDVVLEDFVEVVLNTYLDPSVWYLQLNVISEDDSESDEGRCVSLVEAQCNVIQACLMVEGIGKMATVLGEKFARFLLQTMYVVLERAGSGNEFIAAAGLTAVHDIARACGHGRNASDLVQRNVDYFSYHVTRRIRKVEQNPGVLDVLNIVMKYSTIDVLPCLEEIVENALLHSCDIFQDQNTLSFLRVFYTFTWSVNRWIKLDKTNRNTKIRVMQDCEIGDNANSSTDIDVGISECDTKNVIDPLIKEKENISNGTQSSGKVVDALIEYHSHKERSKDFIRTDDIETNVSGEEMMQDEEEHDKKAELPLHVKMVVAVLKRCLHFLPTKKREQKLLVLSVLKEGLLVLEKWENELLPVVHEIWSPFVSRFKEISDPLVVNHSFSLLCVLARLSKDFIHARTVKEVLPSLCQFLIRSAEGSKMKDSGSSYRFRQEFKLQRELLANLAELATHLNLREQETDQVMTAAEPYLSSLQPIILQDCCVELFKTLAANDPDAVWLKIINICSVSNRASMDIPGLHPVKVNKYPAQNQGEFKKNAERILAFLHVCSR